MGVDGSLLLLLPGGERGLGAIAEVGLLIMKGMAADTRGTIQRGNSTNASISRAEPNGQADDEHLQADNTAIVMRNE